MLLPGCYLGHVAAGQAELLWARRPIERVLADPAITDTLRQRLGRVQQVRRYAMELGLSVESRYRHYAPWPGDRVVTTVVATRPGEIEPAGFWFPIVGHVPYKGFFDVARADAFAEQLRDEGLDVCEVPVRAYSTLGWFDDPVTDPMLQLPEPQLVETLLHELVHATTFVASDAVFNEGVASFVGEEGAVRFYAAREGEAAAERERQRVIERRRLRHELLRLRTRIGDAYQSLPAGAPRDRLRQDLEREARARIAAQPLVDGDPEALSASLRLNDACLALVATYAADTACYAAELRALGGDLRAFVARLRETQAAEDPRGALLGVTPCPAASAPEAS